MKNKQDLHSSFLRKKHRVRSKVKKLAIVSNRPRFTIFKSNQHLYAQLISDQDNKTLASASTVDRDLKKSLKSTCNIEAAKAVGKLLAERAKSKGIAKVVYDRSGYLYHGRIKAIADAARDSGLDF